MFPSNFWYSQPVIIIATIIAIIWALAEGNIWAAIAEIIFLFIFIFFYEHLKSFADSWYNRLFVALIFLIAIAIFGMLILRENQIGL